MCTRRFALIFAIILSGCVKPREAAERTLDRVGPETLREDAARIYKDLYASRAPDFIAMKPSRWPSSFRVFKPEYVGAYRDGLVIALDKSREGEAGLYVVPLGMDLRPADTATARFERLTEGVYWYQFDRALMRSKREDSP